MKLFKGTEMNASSQSTTFKWKCYPRFCTLNDYVCACIVSRFSRIQLFATLWIYSPPDSSAHGIPQARILEWVAIPSPGDLPDPQIKPEPLSLQYLLH